ncbi:hypothetical protein EWN99_21270 [Salmonella enterica]|jgi:hypothetical protein|nr:hypothetical protein [Salmonella enterica]EEE9160396.1 hypothetical protein [Salmonella enterica subsp. enterica serovar Kimberley]EBN6689466.1 hypothetical protein [Salmonella enterica]EGU8718969.1 hypothetical protein [Salmonella enterica]EJI7102310.1 hypothetical protein [Salmonella enterica]
MNCSDNVSSDAVLPEENIFSSHQTGMGYAHINQLLPRIKWNNNDLIIIYDPTAAFRDVFSDALIASSSCEYAGRDK